VRRIFAQGIAKSDWVHLNRPMCQVYDQREEAQRREEYALLLKHLAYSDLMPGSEPDRSDDFPAWILDWQYSEGLLVRKCPLDRRK